MRAATEPGASEALLNVNPRPGLVPGRFPFASEMSIRWRFFANQEYRKTLYPGLESM